MQEFTLQLYTLETISSIYDNVSHTMPVEDGRVDTVSEGELISRVADTRLRIRHSAVAESAE